MLLEVNRERKPVNCPGGVFFVARLRVVSIHEVPRRVVFPETKLPVELSEKALEPPFLAPRAAKQSYFGLFRRLLRLQFGAFQGFQTVSLGRWVNRGNSPPTLSFVSWQAVRSSAKLVSYGIACAHSGGHISGSVGDLGPSSNTYSIGRRVGGASHQCRGWGATVVPDQPLPFSADPHQHHHRAYLCHRRCGWLVDHRSALSAEDSLLRSRNGALCLRGKTT